MRIAWDSGRGQPRKPRPAPLYTVKELIEAQPASAWQTISWREGTKGTMQVQAVALRVHWATGSSLHSTSHSRVHTGPEGWRLPERLVADDPQPSPGEPQQKEEEKIKYRFSVLPPETSLEHLVLLAHARWVIEQFYEDARAANVTWMTSRGGAGMDRIGIWLWSCSPTVSSCFTD